MTSTSWLSVSAVRRTALRLLLATLALYLVLTVRLTIAAAEEESEASQALTTAIDDFIAKDLPGTNYAKSEATATDLLAKCARKGCTIAARAKAQLALGVAQAQLKKKYAKDSMESALKLDPQVDLPGFEFPAKAAAIWNELKPKKPDSTAPTPEAAEKAKELLGEAVKALEEGRYDDCVEKDRASLELDNRVRTRLHLTLCLYRANKLKEALREGSTASELARKTNDTQMLQMADDRVKQLIALFPKIKFILPEEEYQDFKVTFDDKEVPKDKLALTPNIDPGPHVVEARGTKGGKPFAYVNDRVFAREKQIVTVKIEMKPESVRTRDQLECIKNAPDEEAAKKCVPQDEKNIVIKASADVNAYMDTTAVRVFSPGISGTVYSPTGGWNVGGNYLIDIVSAASPDIVSYASPPFREVRHAGSLYAGYKPGPWGVQVNGSLSSEPDYLSRTIGVSGTYDLNDKLTTPRIGVSYTWDKVGRKPFSDCTDIDDDRQVQFASKDETRAVAEGACYRPFRTWTFDAGLTQVVSPTMLLQFGLTAQFERGDQSKPYRYVPMFIATNAKRITEGSAVTTVNQLRESVRPREQLPEVRDRYAFAIRLIKRIGSAMTLRAEERLYYDTWSTLASTTDVRYLVDIGSRFRIWPHVRFHIQTAASFFQLAYVVPNDAQNQGRVKVPLYRTGDRELSSMFGATLGGGAHLALGNLDGETKAGLTLAVDAMLNQYSNTLFVTGRTALYSSFAFDVEF
jgi:hypothetical protein